MTYVNKFNFSNDLSEAEFHLLSYDTVVLVLPCDGVIYFNGILDVQVFFGTVEVFGHILSPGKLYTLFSPKGASLLGINAIDDKENELSDVTKYVPFEFVSKVLLYRKPRNCILVLKRNYSYENFTDFLKSYIPFKLFPNVYEHFNEIEVNLRCIFETANTGVKYFIKLPEWRPIEDLIAGCDSSSKDCSATRLMLCGGSGVGKSTLLRYLVNKALNTHEKVLILDFDPGQSEFTVMGCLSAVLVDKPLFGPNFVNLQSPIYCLHLGEISVVNCITQYLKYVEKVVNFCQSNDSLNTIPWIVNTMGFSKGVGVKLTASIICCVSPTDVVQINSKNRDCNFPEALSEQFISDKNSLLPEVRLTRSYTLHQLVTACDKNSDGGYSSAPWGLKSAIKRDIVTLSYFFKSISPSGTYLTDSLPYKMDSNDLKLIVPDQDRHVLTQQEKFEILNGNLVSLCREDEENVTHHLGFGIVRGINFTQNALYIVTPLTVNVLAEVNAIIMQKCISLPQDVYLLQNEYMETDVPFIDESCSTHDLNKRVRRTFRPLKRNSDLVEDWSNNDDNDCTSWRCGSNVNSRSTRIVDKKLKKT